MNSSTPDRIRTHTLASEVLSAIHYITEASCVASDPGVSSTAQLNLSNILGLVYAWKFILPVQFQVCSSRPLSIFNKWQSLYRQYRLGRFLPPFTTLVVPPGHDPGAPH